MRIAERLSLPEWRMGAVCCMTGGNVELYARRCRNGQKVQIQIFLDGYHLEISGANWSVRRLTGAGKATSANFSKEFCS